MRMMHVVNSDDDLNSYIKVKNEDLLSGKEELTCIVVLLCRQQTDLEAYKLLKCMLHIPFVVLYRRRPTIRRSVL